MLDEADKHWAAIIFLRTINICKELKMHQRVKGKYGLNAKVRNLKQKK